VPSVSREDPERPTLIDVGAAEERLPRAIAPMRPRLAAAAFNSVDWIFELKWDGIRALAFGDPAGAVRLQDRHGGDLLPLVPELRDVRVPEGSVLDGEVIVCDSRGRPSYELLAARAGPKALRRGRGPYFVAFDLLFEAGRPLIGRPLLERRERLRSGPYSGRRVLVPEHLDADGEPFLDVVAEYGLEGIVAKRRDGRYVPGTRTVDWLKCHVTPRTDVVLGGLISDEHGARIALCGLANDDGSLTHVGDAAVPPFLAKWLAAAAGAFESDRSSFAGPIPLRSGLRWLRPKLVAIVEHDGDDPLALGDARFRALRFDARVDECRPEEPLPVPSAPPTGAGERPRLVLLQSLPFS
jgi:bifunctional non-homologous end joining protein LigD